MDRVYGAASGGRKRLPPLNLFRAFDAVARHLSFTLAAEEIHVTQSAVSQQIRQLEGILGVQLFQRTPRHLALTRGGAALANTISEALRMISEACTSLSDPEAGTVWVAASPGLATRWLLPRLTKFTETHPQLKIALIGSVDDVSFYNEDVDVVIAWSSAAKARAGSLLITPDTLVAVCSPAFLTASGVTDFQRLKQYTHLQVVNRSYGRAWLAARKKMQGRQEDVRFFSDGNLMIEAALRGQGVCLVSALLIASDVRAGRLIPLFTSDPVADEGYYFTASPKAVKTNKVAAFRNWLISEAKICNEDARALIAPIEG